MALTPHVLIQTTVVEHLRRRAARVAESEKRARRPARSRFRIVPDEDHATAWSFFAVTTASERHDRAARAGRGTLGWGLRSRGCGRPKVPSRRPLFSMRREGRRSPGGVPSRRRDGVSGIDRLRAVSAKQGGTAVRRSGEAGDTAAGAGYREVWIAIVESEAFRLDA
jgi:hypothetical protein